MLMLWYCRTEYNDATLTQRIVRAADYYRRKYGAVPNTCLVNSAEHAQAGESVGIVKITKRKDVQPQHLLIGIMQA